MSVEGLGQSLGEIVPATSPDWLTSAVELDAVRRISVLTGQRRCLAATFSGETARIERSVGPSGAKARLTGVRPCGLATCPNCARRTRLAKSVELEHLLGRLLDEPYEIDGQRVRRSLYMVTLTASHRRGEALGDVLARVNGAAKRLMSGRQGQSWRDSGLEIICRAVEVTYGASSWHPHIHALVQFTPQPLGFENPVSAQVAGLFRAMQDAWLSLVNGRAGEKEIAFQVVPVHRKSFADMAGYVAGVSRTAVGASMEVVRHDLKRARSGNVGAFELPQLLARLQRGEEVEIAGSAATEQQVTALWREWETAMRGVHQVALGRKFAHLRLTPEQLAVRLDEITSQPTTEASIWEPVQEIGGHDLWLMRRYGVAPVLLAASTHGAAGVDLVLDEYRDRFQLARDWAERFCAGWLPVKLNVSVAR